MDLRQIREDIADVLQAGLTDWRVYSHVPSGPIPPAVCVGAPAGIEYRVSNLNGGKRFTLPVILVLGKVDDRTTQQRLDVALSTGVAGSVVDVLDAERSGSGRAWTWLQVDTADEARVVKVGEADLVALDINVLLISR